MKAHEAEDPAVTSSSGYMPKGLRRSLFKAWLTLMRNNDVKAALDRCRGSAFWASAGRNACRVPLWLDGPDAVP